MPKKQKSALERVVAAISEFMGRPVSDETDETPHGKQVSDAKKAARGATRKKRAAAAKPKAGKSKAKSRRK